MTVTKLLEEYFQELEQRDKFSGAVLITRGESQLFAGTYGYASRTWKIPNNLDTRFDTASISKLFTSSVTPSVTNRKIG